MLDLLSEAYCHKYPQEAAADINRFGYQDISNLLDELQVQTIASLAPYLDKNIIQQYFSDKDTNQIKKILNACSEPALLRVILKFARHERQDLIELLPTAKQRFMTSHLRYGEDKIGSHVDTHVLTIPISFTISRARTYIQSSNESFSQTLYVVDEAFKLKGFLDIKSLIIEKDDTPLHECICYDIISLPAQGSIHRAHTHPAWHQFRRMPVVTSQQVFLGILYFEEATRQIQHDVHLLPTVLASTLHISGAVVDSLHVLTQLLINQKDNRHV